MSETSKRVRDAEAEDRADLQRLVRQVVRSDEERAAWLIACFETETGRIATAADWDAAREISRLYGE